MTNDDEAARHKRAASLRQTIERLKVGRPEAKTPKGESGPEQESPRDFVERRTRELDDADKRQDE
jgi:hypothetical protein